VATSRRRERELARRRYERRRQAELERRARNKRRNTIAGAVTGTAIVIAVLLILTFTVFTGSGKKSTASLKTHATPSTSASASPTAAPAAPTKCAAIKPNPPIKGAPVVPPVTGKVPTKLTTKDIQVGHGKAATTGSSVDVYYVGVSCSTGKMFDSSWSHPPLAPFTVSPLGSASVISGWNKGLIGVRAGGIRELIIPAADGYGSQGSGAIKPNETLIFVVKVKSVK
jgi:peptidylprolyl isomerase